MRLLEFFSLNEEDDDDRFSVSDKPPVKGGLPSIMAVGKKSKGPGKPGSTELPPTEKQRLWQQTQDFLAKNDPKKTGIPKSSSQSASHMGQPSQSSVVRGKSGSGNKPGSPVPSLYPDEKPKYPGHFFGQSADLGGQYKRVPASWVDKETGERKYGGVQSKVNKKAVWNGSDWVTPEEFSTFGKKT